MKNSKAVTFVRMKPLVGYAYVCKQGKLIGNAKDSLERLAEGARKGFWCIDGCRIARVEVREITE